jgi:hypothetical protein
MKLLYKLGMMLVFVLSLLLAMTFDIEAFAKFAYSQLPGNPQIWKDTENNVRILFSYSPNNPAINTPTELRFTINDLQSGAPFKNVLITVNIIGNNSFGQQKVVKFSGLSDNRGNYLINYAFPDLGIYQVIMRTKSSNPQFATLASFPVNVALETSLSNIAIIGIIVVVAGAISAGLVVRYRYK